MPFKSKAQQRFMFATKPKGVDLKEWAAHTDFAALPEKAAMPILSDGAASHTHQPVRVVGAIPGPFDRKTAPITTRQGLEDALRFDRMDTAEAVRRGHAVMPPTAVDGHGVLDEQGVVALRGKLAFFATEKLAALAVPPRNDFLSIAAANHIPEQLARAQRFHALLSHPDPAVQQQGQHLLQRFNEKSTAVGQYLTSADLERQGFRPKTAGRQGPPLP